MLITALQDPLGPEQAGQELRVCLIRLRYAAPRLVRIRDSAWQ
jgi:hypothetical protein